MEKLTKSQMKSDCLNLTFEFPKDSGTVEVTLRIGEYWEKGWITNREAQMLIEKWISNIFYKQYGYQTKFNF